MVKVMVRADRNKLAASVNRNRIKGPELYSAYKNWAEEAGYEPKGPNRILTVRQFTSEAKKRLEHYTSNGLWYFATLVTPNSASTEGPDDSDVDSWTDGEINPGCSEKQKTNPMGNNPETTIHQSNNPTQTDSNDLEAETGIPNPEESEFITFSNTDTGDLW